MHDSCPPGYFVLRFLAEDVGKRLDDVLDRVIAALVHRRGNPARPERDEQFRYIAAQKERLSASRTGRPGG
ncbi:MAG: hypothetical protein Q7S40_19365 [Opitutaceae bacterium]|nr:hypothetical protein [Opitutaceae bacterium]